ncbi:bifunctional diguanylate cyclase/phosphodiesterase [Afifella sp. IM 167]|uniref:putative bifunctional diguanylate cyclase/phosphodiesterase n=1 Tax=Afifella sp. IM 167 TaxID=2033586 RepID=UPI001CCFA1C2|nr:EAL domain-containing protein [Afifella sp. IM 167]
MLRNDRSLMRLIKWTAAVAATAIAVGVPGGYLLANHARERGELVGEIEVKASQVSQIISGNPDFWSFEGLRIRALIADLDKPKDPALHRVLDEDGQVVAQSPQQEPAFSWPVMTEERALFSYGVPAGKLIVTHSLRSVYENALALSVFSFILGALAYWALRVVPLRLLNNAWMRISYLANHDHLTGLPNRMVFRERLEQALQDASGSGKLVCVLALDLDRFKDVNDTLGHAAGDLILKRAADRIMECLRPVDTLARLGGDEFNIIRIGDADPAKVAELAERIVEALDRPFRVEESDIVIGVSIGIAMGGRPETCDAGEVLKNADLALYKSKRSGRATYHFYREEMNREMSARKSLESDLRKALVKGEFELHYQPQIRLQGQRITGAEALLRWHHPKRGNVSPAEFIPVAEATGIIRPLSEWVLKVACRDALAWSPLVVAVNLSPALFQNVDIEAMVSRALSESGLPAERLELEITEDVLMSDTANALAVLEKLKALGVQIAMDDFGTGYSSLSYLRQFPFDKIKIDRSFIGDIGTHEGAQAIVQAIIRMGHALKMRVNAEGVETIEQANVLFGEGCEEAQGYLYARPMPKRDIETLFQATRVLDAAAGEASQLAVRSA